MMNILLRRLTSTTAKHTLQWRSYASATRPIYEKVVMPVPTMGDSITEGTIVEWTVDVGQAVQEGDVVALIETDKVTVDIKAQSSGVITQHFGQVDDTVEVGAKLYEVDSEGVASSATSAPVAAGKESMESQATKTPSETETKPATLSDKSDSHRTPSIQFLGKTGWEALRTKSSKTVVPDKSANPLAITIVYEDTVDPMYGRPKFTEEEMENLMMGGATLAPKVVNLSSGASFSP